MLVILHDLMRASNYTSRTEIVLNFTKNFTEKGVLQ